MAESGISRLLVLPNKVIPLFMRQFLNYTLIISLCLAKTDTVR